MHKEQQFTILVAEDDTLIRISLYRHLARRGYQVIAVDNGEDASLHLTSGGIDCAIIDYHLPAIQGYELLLQINKEPSPIPVIVMTGDSSPEVEKMLRHESPAFYFVKPVNFVDLDAVIDRIRDTRVISQRKF